MHRSPMTWRVSMPQQETDTTITAYPLRLIILTSPDTYDVRLTITDNTNGIKYFRYFRIKGETQFSDRYAGVESGRQYISIEFCKT